MKDLGINGLFNDAVLTAMIIRSQVSG